MEGYKCIFEMKMGVIPAARLYHTKYRELPHPRVSRLSDLTRHDVNIVKLNLEFLSSVNENDILSIVCLWCELQIRDIRFIEESDHFPKNIFPG